MNITGGYLMKVLDSHIHIGSWRNYEIYKDFPAVTTKEIQSLGIDGGVLFATSEGKNSFRKPEGEWFKFGWVNYNETTDNREEIFTNLDRWAGLKIHPAFNKCPASHKCLHEIYHRAEELDKPIMIHAGRWDISDWKYAIQVAEKFDVKVIIAHLGGNEQHSQVDAPSHVLFNVKTDVRNRIWFDTSMARSWTLQKAVDLLGSSHFVFGSGYPINHPQVGVAMIQNLNLDETEKEDILSVNLLEIMK